MDIKARGCNSNGRGVPGQAPYAYENHGIETKNPFAILNIMVGK